ncbi:MAG: rhodanese-like domain-containing protein [Acetobacteraceae bacterium]|nr:rhodanese-like domain-containing protein [Acetobacteraceae bacterium]
MPLPELTENTPDLARRNQPIVVVCKTDRRSARAAAELVAAGLKDVAVLRGGTDGWHDRGLPGAGGIVRPFTCPPTPQLRRSPHPSHPRSDPPELP